MDTISADELTKEYGENLAVNRLSLSVGSEIYGLLGPNGSGKTVVVVAPIVLICTVSMMEKSQAFNAMSSGDDVARTLGADVDRFRRRSLITVSFSTSACIAFTGIIGFIGLMSPHICRMIMGNDQRFLIPASALMGALILLISDTAARTVLSPVEIPVGVIMYVLGGIFFVYLITRGQGRGME